MNVTAYKTHKIGVGEDLYKILDKYLPKLAEKDIVVVTSKIVSLCQGRVVKNDGSVDKTKLIESEAQLLYKTGKIYDKYQVILTITEDILVASAGIDESNGNGYFILWPKNIHKTATAIWEYLREIHGLKHLGVIISDSKTTPLRWGTTGVGLAWAGFAALSDYVGTPDIYGKYLRMTKGNVLDGLSAAAVVVMGEGDEQTPLAVISDTNNVTFQDKKPTVEEVKATKIVMEDDLYAPLLSSVDWKKGNKSASEK